MKGANFDAILASVPINADAAKAMSGGVHFEPQKRVAQLSWDAPPLMRPIPDGAQAFIGGIPGTKFGRFTVIGLLDEPRKDKTSRAAWVVRCVCGAYETRNTRAVRNPKNANDSCQHCRYLTHIRDRYASLGSAPITRGTAA